MILISCARVPDGISKSELAELVRARLGAQANAEYIDSLEKKSNDLSARESLFALKLLCDMIRRISASIDVSSLILARGKCGKPYFANSPLKFNLSHSRGFVACALSDAEDVGIDIEAALPSADRAKRLSERFFDAAGKKAVEEDPSRFARLWSEKEAAAKFFGTNLTEFLESERKNQKNEKNEHPSEKVSLHCFSYCQIPVTLCTKRNFSTIIFTDPT